MTFLPMFYPMGQRASVMLRLLHVTESRFYWTRLSRLRSLVPDTLRDTCFCSKFVNKYIADFWAIGTGVSTAMGHQILLFYQSDQKIM